MSGPTCAAVTPRRVGYGCRLAYVSRWDKISWASDGTAVSEERGPGGVVVRAMDLRLQLDPRTTALRCFQVTTLGKLFTHTQVVLLSARSIIWSRSRGGDALWHPKRLWSYYLMALYKYVYYYYYYHYHYCYWLCVTDFSGLDGGLGGAAMHTVWPSRPTVFVFVSFVTDRNATFVARHTWGDSDAISMPAGYHRHVVGKTLRNVFHCDVAEIRLVGKLVIIQTFS